MGEELCINNRTCRPPQICFQGFLLCFVYHLYCTITSYKSAVRKLGGDGEVVTLDIHEIDSLLT